MQHYYEAPSIYVPQSDDPLAVFLAGGITDCPDWQKEVTEALRDCTYIVLNPRRANFPIDDPRAARDQIAWEHEHLHKTRAITFWFCKETICPIVLYELGTWTTIQEDGFPFIVIGIEPEYERRQDVEVQTRLVNQDIPIVYSLDDMVEQLRTFEHDFNTPPEFERGE